MKFKKRIVLELERYPEKCSECPMFHTRPYQCHNERGVEGRCELGYMSGCDMRDFNGRWRFENCNLENDPDVYIMEE